MPAIEEAMPLFHVGWPVILGTVGGRLAATHTPKAPPSDSGQNLILLPLPDPHDHITSRDRWRCADAPAHPREDLAHG